MIFNGINKLLSNEEMLPLQPLANVKIHCKTFDVIVEEGILKVYEITSSEAMRGGRILENDIFLFFSKNVSKKLLPRRLVYQLALFCRCLSRCYLN